MRFKTFLSEIKISLKSHPNLDAFMEEYHEGTTPHPWSPRMAIWQDKVMAEISKWQGAIHISSVMSLEKNQGAGSEFMKWLTNLADKHQVKMDLTVKPLKNAGGREGKDLTKTQLKAWYARNGFKKVVGDTMEREPKSLTEAVIKPWAIKEIDVRKAVNLLNVHCSEGLKAISTKGLLYRGFKHNTAVMTIDPSKGERTSKDTNNLYQLMMDLSNSLKDFPSRSKSLICSSSLSEAASYGTPMVIIPFDGTTVTVSGQADFLNSEIKTTWTDGMDVDMFSDQLESVLVHERIIKNRGSKAQASRRQITAADVPHINKEIEVAYESFMHSWIQSFPDTDDKDLDRFMEENKSQALNAIASALLTPQSLGLKQVKFGKKLPNDAECWFSGPCIAIDARLFAGILDALRADGHRIDPVLMNSFIDFFYETISPRGDELIAGDISDDTIRYIQTHLK